MAVTVRFGIYLGNSSCCVAVNRDGKIDVVANASGDRVTPAVVGFHDTEVVTGTAAKQGLVRHETSSIVGALRAIGSTSQDELLFPLNLKCQLLYDSKRPKFALQNSERTKPVTPEEVLRHLFTLLKEIASSHSVEEKLPVVITLPAWVSDTAVSAVHQAASSAGFHILSTISQPAAACLAYDILEDNKVNINVVTLHCGGTSIVATLGEISGGLLTIKETSSPLTLSGDSITSVLVDHFAKEFFVKYKGNPLENRRSKRKLYYVSENCKHVLSTINTAQVHAESLWEGVDFSTQLSRARFDGLISSTLTDFLIPVKDVLERGGITADQVHKVILTGGSCKILKLQQLISDAFPNAEVLKKHSADEVLAIGAAVEAAHYPEGKSVPVHSSTCLLTCLSIPVYAKILEKKESSCIFSSGTPTHSRQSLTLECPSGPCSLLIYEAKEPTECPDDEQLLAQVELNFSASDVAHLQLDSILKSDGSLAMKLIEPFSKITKSFTIEAGRC